MTVIAYDGRYVAADKQSTGNGTKQLVTKLFVHGDEVIAISGNAFMGRSLAAWWKGDRRVEDWPQRNTKESDGEACNMYVFKRDCHVREFGTLPIPIDIEGTPWSAGSGGDLALGAMAAGKSAAEAVEIANRFEVHCGMGVDVIDLWSLGDADRLPRATPAAGGPGVLPL